VVTTLSTIMPPAICDKKCILRCIWPDRDLNTKIWWVQLAPKIHKWWKFGRILSAWYLANNVCSELMHGWTKRPTHAWTLWKRNASGHYTGDKK